MFRMEPLKIPGCSASRNTTAHHCDAATFREGCPATVMEEYKSGEQNTVDES